MNTIAAIATPTGIGALGIIRLSGPDAITIADVIFVGKKLQDQESHTLHFGTITTAAIGEEKAETIDEVVVSLYRNPRSYTGEDVVEISSHGSQFILSKILDRCLEEGAVMAAPGEYTQRAFLNGKLDLVQAEAVADLIATESAAAHKAAIHNLRGGFSAELAEMREALINFSALIELELDFSQEDVEFADRNQLNELLDRIDKHISQLIASFAMGNAVKHGVSVAIIGAPNAGKSTLLNSLLNEERAIVSNIAGTTRDSIEEVLFINGMKFRIIDTAGIRESAGDEIEDIGIARSKANAEKADIIIHLTDLLQPENNNDTEWIQPFHEKTIEVKNKVDLLLEENKRTGIIANLKADHCINAKNMGDAERIKQLLYQKAVGDRLETGQTIITNARHLDALKKVATAITDIRAGLAMDISGELVALDLRQALHYIGEITGTIQTDRDVLGAVFGKFCIGK